MPASPLAFYEHARQSYGSLPLNGDDQYQWHVGGYSAGAGVDERGEFRLGMWVSRPHATWETAKAFVRLIAYPDAAGAVAEFVAAGGMQALASAKTADDVTAALLGLGLADRSDHPTRVVPCPCCVGQGKVRAEERAAIESVLHEVKP